LPRSRTSSGTFFHKLYYWSDYLKEKPARKSADSTAAQMLERTIKNLEDFLKLSLDYFHPTQLSFPPAHWGGRAARGFLVQVRAQLNGTPITVLRQRRVAEGGRRGADRSGAPLARLRGGRCAI